MAKQFKPETLCVQAGWTPKKGEPRVLPIYQSTTFKYDTSEQMARLFDLEDSGYFYTRLQNPTNDAVAAKIAALEGGVAAMLTSSGQAANFYAIFNICQAGDHFVCSSAIYGGTFNLFGVTMKKLGIEVTFVNPDAGEEEISAAFRPNTKALFGETISNPSLEVLDIEKFARIAHSHGVPLIVDNTFPTPINCRPFEWGADIVVHSTTKYMDGHATSVGGCIVDSGNFDWDAHADKFPGLCTPDESYHGLTYTKAFCPTSNLYLGSGLFNLKKAWQKKVKVGMGTDIGAGTTFNMLQTLNEAYKVLQLQGYRLSAYEAFYLATLGGAKSLGLDDLIGNFLPGKEADFVVMEPTATPLQQLRYDNSVSLVDKLFVMMTLGDDRSIYRTYVDGRLVYERN